jgi:Family of unknown function (DUF5996)
VGQYALDPASMDADRGEDPARADAMAEPLLARDALCDSTGPHDIAIPYEDRTFQIDFDFIDHRLEVKSSDGGVGGFPLRQQSVAVFYRHLMDEMVRLQLPLRIRKRPNEVKDTTPFDKDEAHATYDPDYASRFWRVLVHAERVFQTFRGRFIGKCSPVHFFWGVPDLAVTRFSGRVAPEHPGGLLGLPDVVTREAYSHEVSSCGFWTGDRELSWPMSQP